MRRQLIVGGLCLLTAAPALAQGVDRGMGADGYGDERRWIMEHPEAMEALGHMRREDLGKFLETYRSLSPAEKQKIREHASDLQALGPNERKWALDNPDAVRQLGTMPDDQRRRFLETYKSLSPAEQQKLREHADALQALSPEERSWALEHPDAVRQLGDLPDGERKQMLDEYRAMPPDVQRSLRDGMRGR